MTTSKKLALALAGLFAALTIGFQGCSTKTDGIEMTETPYFFTNFPQGVAPPPVPADRPITQERVALGRKLFYDPRLSADSSLSCASCHPQARGFSTNAPVSVGVKGRLGFRNVPPLVNIGYHPYYFREGGNSSLESQAFGPIEEFTEMDFSTDGIIERLQNDPEYAAASLKAFGKPMDNFVIIRALGAFQRTLVSTDSPYDDYRYRNQNDALSEPQIRGMQLFFSDRTYCYKCHNGFDLSTYELVNNGTLLYYDDTGLHRITGQDSDIGKFKVPTLKNIALTFPYMHNGSFKTLHDVIEHYNKGGVNRPNQSEWVRPLNLNAQEKADLLEFLNSLTDSVFIENPAFRE